MSFLDIQKIIIEIANKNIRAKERKKKKLMAKNQFFSYSTPLHRKNNFC